MVRRAARALRRHRQRGRDSGGRGDGRRPRLYRLGVHRPEEARAAPEYKQAIVDGRAADIVGSNLFTGVYGNYLRRSIVNAGFDPDNLPQGDVKTMNFESSGGAKAKAWRDIWGSGQGIGAVKAVTPVAEFVARQAANIRTRWRVCAQADRDRQGLYRAAAAPAAEGIRQLRVPRRQVLAVKARRRASSASLRPFG